MGCRSLTLEKGRASRTVWVLARELPKEDTGESLRRRICARLAKDSNLSLLRRIAVILLIAASVCFGVAFANQYASAAGGRDISGFYALGAMLTALALGMWAHWKPAAFLFIASSVCLAAWLVIGSLLSVPFPWWLINLLGAALMLIPSLKIIQHWSGLWR